jgi:hypothetical protein
MENWLKIDLSNNKMNDFSLNLELSNNYKADLKFMSIY